MRSPTTTGWASLWPGVGIFHRMYPQLHFLVRRIVKGRRLVAFTATADHLPPARLAVPPLDDLRRGAGIPAVAVGLEADRLLRGGQEVLRGPGGAQQRHGQQQAAAGRVRKSTWL